MISVAKGLDQNFAAGKTAIAALGLLFIVLGNYMPQIRHNYFMGIRTPWTLADPEVWRKTHRLSGFMWMIGGVLILLAAFIPAALSIGMIIAALVIATLIPTFYSWMLAQRVKG
ncbi:Immunity protein SdpI [compost metagenome]